MMARGAVAPLALSCCASPPAWAAVMCGTGPQIGVRVFDRPRLRMLNSDGIVGGGLPSGIPRQRPPWFSSDAQYEAFLQMTARDLGPQCITATSVNVEHLDEPRRKEVLSA